MQRVRLRSKVGEAEYRASWGGKPTLFKFTEKNNFECEVPTKVEYKDSFGELKVAYANYAQFLLDHYPDALEIAEVIQDEAVVAPSPKSKSKTKGKKHEEVSG